MLLVVLYNRSMVHVPQERKNNMAHKVCSTIRPEVHDALKAEAERRACTVASLLNDYAGLAGMSPLAQDRLRAVAEGLGMAPHRIVEGLLLKELARELAEVAVFGRVAPRELPEFQYTNEGPVVGEALVASLKEEYVADMKRERRNAQQKH